MAASGSRTLTLKLLADIAAFTSGLDKGKKDVDSFSTQIADFSKKAALAFAAVGAAVGAYVNKVVQNAAEDEAAQRKLALTIENTTSATNEQIAAVENWITKTSVAIGITDDELRPAFARLVRSTKDVENAQNLLNLALDISSATGKPLEAIAAALGKAYDGNAASLGRLGLGLDQSIIKSKDFDLIYKELTKTFGNFAENEATSTEKQMQRVRIAIDEANESIGAALLPVVQDLTGWLLNHFVPALQATIGGLTGDESVKSALGETYQEFYRWGERIRSVIKTVVSLKEEILIVAGVMATMFVVSKIAAGIAATITVINTLIKAYNALKASAFLAGVASAFALNPALGAAVAVGGTAAILAAQKFIEGSGSQGVQMPASATAGAGILTGTAGIYGSTAPSITGGGGGGSVNFTGASTAAKATATASNTFASVGAKPFSQPMTIAGQVPNNVTVNIGVAGDPEGTAREIIKVLNNSFTRGTGGASALYAI